MPENNLDIEIVEQLICGVAFDEATRRLVVDHRVELTEQEICRISERCGLGHAQVEDRGRQLGNNFPVVHHKEAEYCIYSDSKPLGTVIYLELKEEEVETITLLKISAGRFYVVETTDKSLKIGDILNTGDSTMFCEGNRVKGRIENDSEVAGYVYASLPICNLRVIIPSIAYRVLDTRRITTEEGRKETNMSALIGRYKLKVGK